VGSIIRERKKSKLKIKKLGRKGEKADCRVISIITHINIHTGVPLRFGKSRSSIGYFEKEEKVFVVVVVQYFMERVVFF